MNITKEKQNRNLCLRFVKYLITVLKVRAEQTEENNIIIHTAIDRYYLLIETDFEFPIKIKYCETSLGTIRLLWETNFCDSGKNIDYISKEVVGKEFQPLDHYNANMICKFALLNTNKEYFYVNILNEFDDKIKEGESQFIEPRRKGLFLLFSDYLDFFDMLSCLKSLIIDYLTTSYYEN